MIVSIAQDIQEKIARQGELTTIRNNQKQIEGTYKELGQVKKSLRDFVLLYQVVHPRLDREDQIPIITTVTRIREELHGLHKQFTSQPYQVKELRNLKREIKQLTQKVEVGWQAYATQQVTPHIELLKLVKQLPEIAKEISSINRLQNQLNLAINQPPRTNDHLKQFDQQLQRLEQHLANLSDLDIHIRTFLNKTLQGQATIADLSPKILVWCQNEGRGRAFKIRF